jgi:hypothetical protein
MKKDAIPYNVFSEGNHENKVYISKTNIHFRLTFQIQEMEMLTVDLKLELS